MLFSNLFEIFSDVFYYIDMLKKKKVYFKDIYLFRTIFFCFDSCYTGMHRHNELYRRIILRFLYCFRNRREELNRFS